MEVLTDSQLKVLRKHKYSVAGQSCLERVFLSSACNTLVEFFPRWVAPNLITFIGAICFIAPGCYLLTVTPTASRQDPEVSSVFWICLAMCNYAYQFLDCIDGKQARRTGTSSPLGEFLDHGIDAFATIILPLTAASCVLLGESPALHIAGLFSASSLFMMAHWHSYVAGKVHVNPMVDVEEARAFFAFLFLLAAVHPLGRLFFTQPIVVPWLPVALTYRDIFFGVPLVFILAAYYICFTRCRAMILQRPASEQFKLYAPLIQLIIWVIPSILVCAMSPLFRTDPQLVLITLALVPVHLIHRLLVMNMCKSPVKPHHPLLLLPIVLLANSIVGVVPEQPLFIFSAAAQLLYIISWSTCMIRQLLNFLEINLLTIPPKSK